MKIMEQTLAEKLRRLDKEIEELKSQLSNKCKQYVNDKSTSGALCVNCGMNKWIH